MPCSSPGSGCWVRTKLGLRLFSALTGLIFVALVFRLGRDAFGPGAGLAAAGLAAISPGLVYSSLDARMYMPAGALALAGTWALRRGLALEAQRGAGARQVARIRPGLRLPDAGLLQSPGRGALRRRPRPGRAHLVLAHRASARALARFRSALLMLVAVALAYLPYAWNAWGASALEGGVITRAAPDVSGIGRVAVTWLLTHNVALTAPATLAATALAWVGVLLGGLSARDRLADWAGARRPAAVPLVLVVLLSQRQALLQPKILAVTTAGPLLLTLGAPWPIDGASRSRPAWPSGAGRARCLAPLLLLSLCRLRRIWQPEGQRDNWEATARYLEAHAGPQDVVLTHLHFYEQALAFYYDGPIVAPFGSRLEATSKWRAAWRPILTARCSG